MVMPQDGLLPLPADLHVPIQHQGIGQVIGSQPGRQTPVEGLAVKDIQRPIPGARDEDIAVADIAVDECETLRVAGPFNQNPGVSGKERPEQVRPARREGGGELA